MADANILAEYWHEPNDTIYWEGPLSCGMYGTIISHSLSLIIKLLQELGKIVSNLVLGCH